MSYSTRFAAIYDVFVVVTTKLLVPHNQATFSELLQTVQGSAVGFVWILEQERGYINVKVLTEALQRVLFFDV